MLLLSGHRHDTTDDSALVELDYRFSELDDIRLSNRYFTMPDLLQFSKVCGTVDRILQQTQHELEMVRGMHFLSVSVDFHWYRGVHCAI